MQVMTLKSSVNEYTTYIMPLAESSRNPLARESVAKHADTIITPSQCKEATRGISPGEHGGPLAAIAGLSRMSRTQPEDKEAKGEEALRTQGNLCIDA